MRCSIIIIAAITAITLLAGCVSQSQPDYQQAPTGRPGNQQTTQEPQTAQKTVKVFVQGSRCELISTNDEGYPLFKMTVNGTATGPEDSTFRVGTSTSIDLDRNVICNYWATTDQSNYPYSNCVRTKEGPETTGWTVQWDFTGGRTDEENTFNIRAHVNFEAQEDSQTITVICR